MFFTKLWETFLACCRWLPSKEFGLMIYSFGPASASGSSLLYLSRPIFHRGKTKYRKIKLLFVHFPYQDWKQSILPRGIALWVSWKKAHIKLTNIV